IPLLAAHFLSNYAVRYNKRFVKRLSIEAEALMVNYSWQGNVRELKNIIERIVVLERAEIILPEHLPMELSNSTASFAQSEARAFVLPDKGISLDDLEKDLIRQAITKANNNKAIAARLLNITYDSLRYQIKRFGL
ncbi:MAG: helix-turn-helix domain-containing protein, partial [Syntrophales bacterium]|nr:helix-turn-helix domain-containing protein [Syntrophales bacterium]